MEDRIVGIYTLDPHGVAGFEGILCLFFRPIRYYLARRSGSFVFSIYCFVLYEVFMLCYMKCLFWLM